MFMIGGNQKIQKIVNILSNSLAIYENNPTEKIVKN